MAIPPYLTTANAARALGVGVSTVKRWVDDGILAAHLTPGGHRKILRTSVWRLVHSGDFPQSDLGTLRSAASNHPQANPRILSQQLFHAFKKGDESSIRALIYDAYHSGIAIEAIADRMISPAMSQIGSEWETGRIGILQEHRGTRLCEETLFQLKSTIVAKRVCSGPLAIGGSPEHDHYRLANLLVELVLLDLGWRVIDLGPHSPAASFHQAIAEFRPRLLWMSVSHLTNHDRFVAEYRSLYQAAERAGVAVALGGRALTAALRSVIPYTFFGDGLEHLAAFARSLNPSPRRPSRGRPNQSP